MDNGFIFIKNNHPSFIQTVIPGLAGGFLGSVIALGGTIPLMFAPLLFDLLISIQIVLVGSAILSGVVISIYRKNFVRNREDSVESGSNYRNITSNSLICSSLLTVAYSTINISLIVSWDHRIYYYLVLYSAGIAVLFSLTASIATSKLMIETN